MGTERKGNGGSGERRCVRVRGSNQISGIGQETRNTKEVERDNNATVTEICASTLPY